MLFQTGNILSICNKSLKRGDYTVTPFESNKFWKINTLDNSPYLYSNLGIKVYRVLYPENHKYIGRILNISSSLYENHYVSQSVDPKVLWYYLDHNYYTDYDKNKSPANITDYNTFTDLSESGSMMTIPMKVFGEGIQKNSFRITNQSTSSTYQYTLVDDGNGNLRDTTFDETKFIDNGYLSLYVGFNEKYRDYYFRNKNVDYLLDASPLRNDIDIIYPKKISYQPGIPTTDTSQSSGVSVALDGGYFKVKNHKNFNFGKDKNFAFSFWVNVPASQSNNINTYNSLFSKNKIVNIDTLDETRLIYTNKDVTKSIDRYPFDIAITNTNSASPYKLVFKQSSALETSEVTSSALATGSWHHVVCQKSSSYLQIWVDGTLNASKYGKITRNIQNTHNFYMGGNGIDTFAFSGSLDEIRVYNRVITAEEISYLANNSLQNGYAYQTSRVGNIFYKKGLVVVSDPRPKYKDSLMGQTGNLDYSNDTYGFDGEFRGTTTFYQSEIICKIRKTEFNFTQNPSIRKDKDSESIYVEDYVTGSFFTPYITTIGLYTDNNELVAVAKLANPIKKRNDVDMNIIVRFDM